LVHEYASVPKPGIGEVVLRVRAASFTPTELAWPSTWVDRAGRDRARVIPAHEVCGTVVALGYWTTGFEVGDVVYGLTDWYRDGAAAEYVAVRIEPCVRFSRTRLTDVFHRRHSALPAWSEARNLAPKPTPPDHTEAAATPMPALTAWQALFSHGRLASGQTVLILGAAGGVGTFAVRLARTAGARVLAYGRRSARNTAKEIGAHEFIDSDDGSLQTAGPDVDLVFDLVGGSALRRAWAIVREGGAVVSVVEDPAARRDARSDARTAFFVVEPSGAMLAEIAEQLEARRLRPVVGETRPLAAGADAFASKAPGGIPGKSVLQVTTGEAL
jgi:NADPH:quinone reductase-like Zn-dependent oxidoreductase